ncbi:hypothetical protein CSX00_09235 [Pseudobutyrivibrio ruminis]|uniref:Teneurin-like YD-shell domain-containing protein n=1 Tax=Pseudobutyrivibrio ruminis TaxID=46206 RepID=A0A2G3E9M3_9FIRM|nr:hypothetical protein CSX00_09235 [Pseudobutyrivibrio ruminis]
MKSGTVTEVVHADGRVVNYTYDNSGYISEINRNRRELDAVSGKYEYSYDAIGRLIKSIHDGAIKAEYQYAAFGNRTSLTEGSTSTTYSYDVLDRLLEVNELNNNQSVVKTYDYDKRGNQTNEYVDGVLNKTFTFNGPLTTSPELIMKV